MIRISVTVHPGSSRRKLVIRPDGVHLYTAAKPVEGKANREARELLSEYFSVSKSGVTLFKGDHSKKKVFDIDADRSKVMGNVDTALADIITTCIREV
jgi:uncharacterized protein YggU (UPF0235/DUF167 family)